MFGFKRRRRERLRGRPFPDEWLSIIERNVPYYRLLSPPEQRELQGHVQILLAEKRFEGCGGLRITDEVRLTIAAQAAVLLLHRETDYFPGLRTILVYPSAYVSHMPRRQPDGTVIEGPQVRSGESWSRGPVVLSWDDVLRGAGDVRDGHNVVFHEFAHQLDAESGADDGAPALGLRSRYIAWARVLGGEFERLRQDVALDRDALLSAYGATNPQEFFAVVTESFFERPLALRARHPELYEQMSSFYRQDPAATWPSQSLGILPRD
jgi:Mlc titration factor MtfA (ptsG expression regulator)